MDFEHTLRPPGQRPTAGTQVPEGYWRSFPLFEKLLEGKSAPLISRMESTWRELDRMISSGLPHEKARARTAQAAYLRAMDLYKRFVNESAAGSAQSRNPAPGPHDK